MSLSSDKLSTLLNNDNVLEKMIRRPWIYSRKHQAVWAYGFCWGSEGEFRSKNSFKSGQSPGGANRLAVRYAAAAQISIQQAQKFQILELREPQGNQTRDRVVGQVYKCYLSAKNSFFVLFSYFTQILLTSIMNKGFVYIHRIYIYTIFKNIPNASFECVGLQ